MDVARRLDGFSKISHESSEICFAEADKSHAFLVVCLCLKVPPQVSGSRPGSPGLRRIRAVSSLSWCNRSRNQGAPISRPFHSYWFESTLVAFSRASKHVGSWWRRSSRFFNLNDLVSPPGVTFRVKVWLRSYTSFVVQTQYLSRT